MGDFIELPEHGELAYKGRVYGPDDIDDFNRDSKTLTTDKRFFSPPYVKLVKVTSTPKKKESPAPEPEEKEATVEADPPKKAVKTKKAPEQVEE